MSVEEMKKTKIDMKTYPRKAHFEYFRNLAYPYVGVTVNVDITDLLKVIKGEGLPFFLTILYAAANAANEVPALRRRIDGDGIVEYERCNTSHTVALEDGTYGYCVLDSSIDFREFLGYAEEQQNLARTRASIEEGDKADSLFFVSSLPWLSYTAIVQPTPVPADSNPRITFGRYFEQNQRMLMPATILVNHALADGKHLSDFYKSLDAMMIYLVEEIRSMY